MEVWSNTARGCAGSKSGNFYKVVSQNFAVAISDNCTKRMLLEHSTRCVYYDGRTAALAPTEFCILSTLVQSKRQTVSLEELSQRIWGLYTEGCNNALRVNICNIRNKIGEPDAVHSCIKTVRHCGYQLVI